MYKKWPISFLVILLVYGCSEQHPVIQPLSDSGIVLVFGDSLTAGTGVSREKSYPYVLASMLNREVINAGFPGETSEYGLKRLPILLDKYQPELVIIAHGGNDLIRNLDQAKLVKNISAMIAAAQQRGVSVILIGMPRPGIFLSSDELYKNVALDYNIPIENEIIADVLSESSLKSDAIHPNAKGYRLIAESINKLMRQSGAI